MVLKIQNVAQQAADRVAQLLAFARKDKYRVEPVNMHQVIEEVIGLLEHTIDKRIVLNHVFMSEQSIISGDRSQLHSALLNLAVNARDALPSGGEILFKTEQSIFSSDTDANYTPAGPPGTFLKLTVQDNGVGMDEMSRSRIFEPFYTTKEQGKGTGLGLANVYSTVKRHNGHIDVESAPGKGTLISVYFPVLAIPPQALSIRPVSGNTGLAGGRILIVDDVELLREMICETLNVAGYVTFERADGKEAIEWYRLHKDECDLVILDLTMPSLNGRECLSALKKINPLIKVILTSGNVMDQEISDVLNEGAVAFLKKPFDSDELINIIGNALNRN